MICEPKNAGVFVLTESTNNEAVLCLSYFCWKSYVLVSKCPPLLNRMTDNPYADHVKSLLLRSARREGWLLGGATLNGASELNPVSSTWFAAAFT